MAKLVFLLVAVFLLTNLVIAEQRHKREEETTTTTVETTTTNYLDKIKSGIENFFSEKNIKTAIGAANDFGEKVKDFGGKAITNVQNAFKSESTPAPLIPAA